MGTPPHFEEREGVDHLAAIKLALQLPERKTRLSDYRRSLVGATLAACDRRSARRLERADARRRRPLSVQAEQLQDDDDHDDSADDRQNAVAAHRPSLHRCAVTGRPFDTRSLTACSEPELGCHPRPLD